MNKTKKFNRVVSLCLLVIISFMSSNLYCIDIDLSKHTGVSAAVRSLILPGWGQYYNEQKQKAYIIAAAVGVFGLMGYVTYNDAEETYRKYEEKGLKDDPLYNEYENKLNTANLLFTLSALCWGYSVVDAYIYGEAYRKKYGFNVDFMGDKLLVRLTYRF